ncbi:MAG TPA: hypothetical protein VGQ73_09160 [Gemmatimonadales bacterium]|nr:hypothetical protein [Gemmatimonadales bacterium]
MERILEPLLAFLFKYPPRLYQRGIVSLAPSVSLPVLAAAALLFLLVLILALRGLKTSAPLRDRLVLGGLRGAVFLLLAGCLLQPVLLLSSAVPQRNVLGILLDDSRSMRLADLPEGSRLDAVRRAFDSAGSITRRLGDRFVLRYFRFAADAGPLAGAERLRGNGSRTDLAGALDAARAELAGVPLAGLILVTDGADNAGADLTAPLLALRARKVPVYSVGVGQERFAKDLAIERVALPASALAGAGVLAEVALRARGLGGQAVQLVAEDEGRVVTERAVPIPERGDLARVRLRLPPLNEGPHRLTFRVRPAPGEIVTENNEYRAVLRVRPGPEKILYLEGEPRPELAFLRRAVAGDSALQVVTLLRSAKGKFLRLGVDDSLELAQGLPTKREELFKYRALVLGSIEAAFFTGDQLRMLGDFVSRRGGGLVVLGGRGALAEGGFAATPLADVLPVSLERPAATDSDAAANELSVRVTPAGRAHPVLQLGATEESAGHWDSLPPLSSVNQLGPLKPGATVLLTGKPLKGGSEQPVLAIQRYGRGTVALVGVQDTWLWQMHASIPLEDQTHETLWRQLLRWSLDGVPERVEVLANPSRAGPGEPVTIQARVTDESFLDSNDAAVTARIVTPSGRTVELPLSWTMRGDGGYEGRFVAEESGMYRLEADARRGRDTSRAAPAALLVDDYGADVEQAELRAPLLRRIAAETGGRYYPLAEAGRLADDVRYTESGVTVRESRDLWDMPAVFLLLIALLGGEWAYRRGRGLA